MIHTFRAALMFGIAVCVSEGWRNGVRANASAEWALQLTDFAALPITGSPNGAGNNAGSLARINFMREEPSPARRFFVNDLNGPLYILDRKTKQATKYLDFDGRGTRSGLFDKMAVENGLASGFISFQFDPGLRRNGKFYTIHLEDLWADGSAAPTNTGLPGLALAGYAPSTAIRPPGEVDHEAVLIEWADSNIANATFEGTARELMRVQLNSRIHPMGDMIFNPVARRGDPDWRVLYISCGDGGAGDQRTGIRLNGQRLDTMVGKILRIVPDLSEHVDSSTVSENGRYRVPRDNPFVSVEGARKEIWAYGLRNPHRLTWDVDPTNSANDHLIATVIGWRTWEMTVIIHKGANYGFPLREGNETILPDGTFAKPTDPDAIPVQVTDTIVHGTVKPMYPVLQYGHTQTGGDAIAGGFVYRGKAVPTMRGKYVFGDISTGRLWYANYGEMLAADDGDPGTLAQIHELRVQWDDPVDAPDRGKQFYPTMFPIVRAAYHSRGGKHADLPGTAALAPSGRVDVRLAVDGGGEFYVLTKSDGMIRLVTGLVHASGTH
jgi:Glucose / Sorbosone dehydrogenase